MASRTKHECWSCGTLFIDVGKDVLACPRCGTEPGVVPEFPAELLNSVSWAFTGSPPADEEELRKQLLAYHADISVSPPDAAELELEIKSCRVTVGFPYKGGEASVVAEQKTFFTAASLLLATHSLVWRRVKKQDHHFFEGFQRLSRSGEPPIYFLRLGS